MPKNTFFVFLICSLHGFWAEGFPPVKLTASRSEIIETSSVTLTCEGRRSSRCFLYTPRGIHQDFSCNQAFTGTELLQMAKRSAPADVGLRCCFPDQSESCSLYSDMLSINVQTLPAPEFTVNPAVITETDTVTLTCAAPSSVSVATCYLYILFESRGFQRNSSCHQTLRGTELLQMVKMESQRLPAEVKVNCQYRAEPGHVLSQYGQISSILIQDEPQKKTDVTTFSPSKTPTGPTSRTSAGPTSRTSAGPTIRTSAGPTSRTSAGPTSRTSAGPTIRTSTGPTSRTSAGPTSRTSAGPTSRTSAGPTSRTESNNNLPDGFTVDKVSDKTSSSATLPDLWILKMLLVALTGFGSVLGIILLLLTFVIRQRADDRKDTREPGKVVPSCNLEPYMIINVADSSCDELEVQIMQETKNDDPDDL